MGLIRKAIVVGGILFALPSPPRSDQPGVADAFATFSAAAETMADMQGFCDRRAQACVTGLYIADVLKGKAQYSAKLIYEWANPVPEQVAEKPAKPAKKVAKNPPPLRLATITATKPSTIEDLLRGTSD